MTTDPQRLPLARWRPVSQVRTSVHERARSVVPCVDAHNHLGRWLSPAGTWMAPDVARLVDDLDRCNVVTVVNLDGRWGAELEENLARYDAAFPGRFVTFAHVDWGVLGDRSSARASDALVGSLDASVDAGARGLKVWKDLGLTVRDATGALVLPDDERVAPVFARCGELDIPVLIHTADPVAFFEPLDERNERIEELARHPDWWFGGPGLPSFARLLEALEAVVAAHPRTTFLGAHVGCFAEDLRWVDRMLGTYPNFTVDTGGRLAELGRQPRAFRRLVERHPDRVLFGSDCYPVDPGVYGAYFRFLETEDECFPYQPGADVPPTGRWDISGAGLAEQLLPAVYRDNAARILGF